MAIEFINELWKRITAVTKEPRETQYLFQRMSVAMQRGNAVATRATRNAVPISENVCSNAERKCGCNKSHEKRSAYFRECL